MPKVDALTLTRNGYKRLKTLHSTLGIQSLALAGKVSWYLWDNASTQKGTKDLIQKLEKDPMIRATVRCSRNESFSRANNQLAKLGKSPYILLLNDDIAFHQRDTLEKMVEVLDTDPKVGIVGAKLIFRDGKIQHGGVWVSPQGLGHVGYGVPEKEADILGNMRRQQAVTGALMLVRRELWEAVGGLDERFFFCFEDVQFCFKVRDLGYDIVYRGDAVAIHDESQTFTENKAMEKQKIIARHYPVLNECLSELKRPPVMDRDELHRADYPTYAFPEA